MSSADPKPDKTARSSACDACTFLEFDGKSARCRAGLHNSPLGFNLPQARIVPVFDLSARRPYFTAHAHRHFAGKRPPCSRPFAPRLLWLAVVIVVIAFGLAQFLNQVAITESREIQAALLAASLRVAAVFIVTVFVITSMVRELNDKIAELLLSLPAPRSAYFFGKFAGYAVVASILALLSALPLVLFANSEGLILWTVSLVCELLIVTAVSLFCVLSFSQVVPCVCRRCGFLSFVALSWLRYKPLRARRRKIRRSVIAR